MQQINLQAVPNQSFTIQLNSNLYDFAVKTGGNFTFVDIIRNGTSIVLGMRAVAGTPLIPYRYLEEGNFLFITANQEYPFYAQFGLNQTLIYASQDEVDSFRRTVGE